MARQYPNGFRNEMVRRLLTGESVLTVCSDTWNPEQPRIGGNTKPSLMQVLSMGSTRLRARPFIKEFSSCFWCSPADSLSKSETGSPNGSSDSSVKSY